MTTAITEVSINNLVRDPNHPRQESGNPETLVLSLQKDGLLTPVSVMKKEDDENLYVIDGWRRVQILKDLGEKSVPCIVSEGYAADRAAHQSYVLNTERNQLNALEIALHIKNMRDKFGYTFQELAIKGYGSKAQLSKKLKILELPEDVQKKIVKGELSVAHGMELLELETDKERLNMAAIAVKKELSAKATEKAITSYKNKSKHQKEIEAVKGSTEKLSITELIQKSREINEKLSADEASEKDATEYENIQGTQIYYQSSEDMSAIEDNSVELVFTSPPCFAEMAMESEDYTFDDYLYEIEIVMEESARVLAEGGILALNITEIHDFKEKMKNSKTPHIKLMAHRYQEWLEENGVMLAGQIVWVKDSGSKADEDKTSGRDSILNQHEFIYIFRKNGERKAPSEEAASRSALTKDERNQYFRSVWTIPPVAKMEGHPAVSPDELARRIIKMYSFTGETVLDPFLGSGTTCKAAQELGRKAIGYEREEKYRELIEQKITSANTQSQKFEVVGAFAKKQLEALENNQPQKTNALSESLQRLKNKFTLISEAGVKSTEAGNESSGVAAV